MSKHKKRLAINNDSLTKNDSMSAQQPHHSEEINSTANAPPKKISGIWPLIIFFCLLALIFILGWLTT